MNFRFQNGTAQQVDLFKDAVNHVHSLCNLHQYRARVNVTFTSDPIPGGGFGFEFGFTEGFAVDGGLWEIRIQDDLLTRTDQFGGEDFFQETVVHELSHVLIEYGRAESGAQARFLSYFRPGPWEDDAWANSVEESVAETFKDIFSPARRYDNRTLRRLPEAAFDDFTREFYRPAQGDEDLPGAGRLPPHYNIDIVAGGDPLADPGLMEYSKTTFTTTFVRRQTSNPPNDVYDIAGVTSIGHADFTGLERFGFQIQGFGSAFGHYTVRSGITVVTLNQVTGIDAPGFEDAGIALWESGTQQDLWQRPVFTPHFTGDGSVLVTFPPGGGAGSSSLDVNVLRDFRRYIPTWDSPFGLEWPYVSTRPAPTPFQVPTRHLANPNRMKEHKALNFTSEGATFE